MDKYFWYYEGSLAFLKELSEDTGDFHECAVYDTGYEFDRNDVDAVRFIANKAIYKAACKYDPYKPSDGDKLIPPKNTVVKIEDAFSHHNANILAAAIKRRKKENSTQGIYIPEQDKYAEMLFNAKYEGRLVPESMPEDLRNEYEAEQLAKKKKEDREDYMIIGGFALFILIAILQAIFL